MTGFPGEILWGKKYKCWHIFCSHANINKDELTPNLFSFQFHRVWHVRCIQAKQTPLPHIFYARKMVRWYGHIMACFHHEICIKLKIMRKSSKQHSAIFFIQIHCTKCHCHSNIIEKVSDDGWNKIFISIGLTAGCSGHETVRKIACFWQICLHILPRFSFAPCNSIDTGMLAMSKDFWHSETFPCNESTFML